MKITVETTFEITDETIETLIDMAGYGISYWASRAILDEENRLYSVQEYDSGEILDITYEKLAQTLVDLAVGKIPLYSSLREYAWSAVTDAEDGGTYIDSELADVVTQVAAFGDIVYG